jgi:cytochrome c peroxidase
MTRRKQNGETLGTAEQEGVTSVAKGQRIAVDGAFKTPTLRNVELTGPYFHNGGQATLEQVVEFYRQGGRPNANLDPLLAPIEMSADDARNLVAFLRALSAQ